MSMLLQSRDARTRDTRTRRLTNWQHMPNESVEEITADLNDFLDTFIKTRQEKKFHELAEQWRKEKQGISSILLISSLPSYRSIMAMGRDAIRFILQELQREPDHWFVALRAIADANGYTNPIGEEDKGNLRKMSDAWVCWGKAHGFLLS